MTLLIFLTFIQPIASWADSDVQNQQKAIMILNFAQRVGWQDGGNIGSYSIAVLGNDPVYSALNILKDQKRTIHGKSFVVKRVSTISELTKFHVVFVNKAYNYRIDELLTQVRGRHTLVVSEGYQFNQSMINMVAIDQTFQYELNETLLNREGFTVSRTLKESAIASSVKWQSLFESTKESLILEQEKVEEQQDQLKRQQDLLQSHKDEIDKQLKQIRSSNDQLDDILGQNANLLKQNQRLKDEFIAENERLGQLRINLEMQREEIKSKKAEMNELDSTINEQNQKLTDQKERIRQQRIMLSEQGLALNYQRNYILFLAIVSFLLVVLGVFIWSHYRIKKRSELELKQKNQAIEQQKIELEIKNVEMEQFAYVASHDLQEPLNAITGLTQLIEKDKLDDETAHFLDLIEESTSRMRRLIKGLLEHSQLGKNIAPHRVDCERVLQIVLSNLATKIEETGADIIVGRLPNLTGYEVQLESLFQNLIGNAMKFRKQDTIPVIDIEAKPMVHEGHRYWKFAVKDNGIGIPEKYKEKVFSIFKRLHSRAEYEGTGIGLAHCKKIVDMHEGKIWVESEVGKGSIFYFTIKVPDEYV